MQVNCGLGEVIAKDFRTRKPIYKYCGKYEQLIGKIHIFRPIYRLCGQVIHGYRLLQCSRANLRFSRWVCINCKPILRLAGQSEILMAAVRFTDPYHPSWWISEFDRYNFCMFHIWYWMQYAKSHTCSKFNIGTCQDEKSRNIMETTTQDLKFRNCKWLRCLNVLMNLIIKITASTSRIIIIMLDVYNYNDNV